MNMLNGVGTLLNGLRPSLHGTALTNSGLDTAPRLMQARLSMQARLQANPVEHYALLRAYYSNNSLYSWLAENRYANGIAAPAMQGLRNPAHRIVEFYPAHLWPGDLPAALPIQQPATASPNDQLITAIQQVWTWSNWAAKKQLFARWLPMLGDVFLKVVQPVGVPRVYFEMVDPASVVDFDVDERGYLTYVRIDVPREERQGDQRDCYTHVEIWAKDRQDYRRWEIRNQTAPATDQLGEPAETIPFRGYDFVPLVHVRYLDIGELRGVGAFQLSLDKIDEVNRLATRLSQLMFRHNRATMAVMANSVDDAGRPLPAPELATQTVGEDADVLYLPGMSRAESLVPNLNYEAYRLWIADTLDELQADNPELAWWRITEQASARDLSSLAIKAMLRPAISRLLEVRGNAEDALARADMMAVSLAQAARLPGFTDLPSYASGGLEHTFAPREVITPSEAEEATTAQVEWTTAVTQASLGVSHSQVLRERGYTDDQIAAMREESAALDVIPTVAP
jgi:hypothetical protein